MSGAVVGAVVAGALAALTVAAAVVAHRAARRKAVEPPLRSAQAGHGGAAAPSPRTLVLNPSFRGVAPGGADADAEAGIFDT
jgi:hypothetical protein